MQKPTKAEIYKSINVWTKGIGELGLELNTPFWNSMIPAILSVRHTLLNIPENLWETIPMTLDTLLNALICDAFYGKNWREQGALDSFVPVQKKKEDNAKTR